DANKAPEKCYVDRFADAPRKKIYHQNEGQHPQNHHHQPHPVHHLKTQVLAHSKRVREKQNQTNLAKKCNEQYRTQLAPFKNRSKIRVRTVIKTRHKTVAGESKDDHQVKAYDHAGKNVEENIRRAGDPGVQLYLFALMT